ncbi:MAG TPA: type II secretion system F family protein [Phycisphaerae bacterium]|nr:type II secretion system F family protein [Phycisphaerae bacterium]HNU44345.1 type II secretion system F family protein [Phycisphaerae bacterium]
MLLTYEAIDRAGKRLHDMLEAADSREAVAQLRARGLYVTRITEKRDAADGAAARAARTGNVSAGRLPVRTLVLFTRQMAMLLRAGSAVVPALHAIRREMRKPAQGVLLDELVRDLEEGVPLTEALRRHPETFQPVYCAVVAAGEASGTLTQMFERLALLVAKRQALRNKVLGALAYPALLVVLCVGIVAALMFFVMPRFAEMFTQLSVEVPTSTRLMLAAGMAAKTYWVGLIAAVAGAVGALVFLVRDRRGRQWLADLQLKVPLLGHVRKRLIEAQVLRTMGMLLESKVGVLDTLELARGVTTNVAFRKLFDGMENAVTGGGLMSTAFEASGIIESYVCQAVKTGEESGNLGGALTYCADILDEGNTELVTALTKLIEPIILIGMGAVVGTVAVSLFMPLFDLTSAIK